MGKEKNDGDNQQTNNRLGNSNSQNNTPQFRIVHSNDARKQSWFSWSVAVVSQFFLIGWFYICAIIIVVCTYQVLVHLNFWALFVLLLLLSSSLYPSQVLWQYFIDLYIWQTLREYFSFTVIKSADFELGQRYLFVEYPHGIFPLGFILSATIVKEHLSGLRIEGAIASILFKIPLLRQLCHWFGARPATSANMRRVLARGDSVGLMAGGIAEIFLSDREQERIYIKKRLGFARIALMEGAHLVPIYYFGNTQILDMLGSGHGLLARISRQLKTSLLLFYGRLFLPIPYAYPITMVVGEPILVQKVDNPSHEQVVELHKKFMEAMVKLFNDHKDFVGWKDKELEIH